MTPDTKERQLLYDLWRDLTRDQGDVAYVENTRVMVQVIIRLIDPKRVYNKREGSQVREGDHDRQRADVGGANVSPKDEGFPGFLSQSGQLCIRPSEVPKI